jgi:hypothetical protein
MTVYDVIDHCRSALDTLKTAQRKQPGHAAFIKSVDVYADCQLWLLENDYISTFLDMRQIAESLLNGTVEEYKYDETQWAYYASKMPMFPDPVATLISKNKVLNTHLIDAVLNWELKSDPYVHTTLAGNLLGHKDWFNWSRYIEGRRHDDHSKINTLLSLQELTLDGMDFILPTLKPLLATHPWKESVFTKHFNLRHSDDIDKIYACLHVAGEPAIINNMFQREYVHDSTVERIMRIKSDYKVELTKEWREKILSCFFDYHYDNMILSSSMVMAASIFCLGAENNPKIIHILDKKATSVNIELLAALSLLKTHHPDVYEGANKELIDEVVTNYLERHPDGKSYFTREEMPIVPEIYTNNNRFKRVVLSNDLGM